MNEMNLIDSDFFEIEKTLNSPGWLKIQEIYRYYAEKRIQEAINPIVNNMREHTLGQVYAYRDCVSLPYYEINKWRKRGKA